jgi:hypothetical protein
MMPFANRFQFESCQDDELLLILGQENRLQALYDFDLVLDEPNLGCVGDYDDADDSENWDTFGLEC